MWSSRRSVYTHGDLPKLWPDLRSGQRNPAWKITTRPLVIGRSAWFWVGCIAISIGVLLHLPMLAEAHAIGNRLIGMQVDGPMLTGMACIAFGVPLACWGALVWSEDISQRQARPICLNLATVGEHCGCRAFPPGYCCSHSPG